MTCVTTLLTTAPVILFRCCHKIRPVWHIAKFTTRNTFAKKPLIFVPYHRRKQSPYPLQSANTRSLPTAQPNTPSSQQLALTLPLLSRSSHAWQGVVSRGDVRPRPRFAFREIRVLRVCTWKAYPLPHLPHYDTRTRHSLLGSPMQKGPLHVIFMMHI